MRKTTAKCRILCSLFFINSFFVMESLDLGLDFPCSEWPTDRSCLNLGSLLLNEGLSSSSTIKMAIGLTFGTRPLRNHPHLIDAALTLDRRQPGLTPTIGQW
ncbi:hypothetical protein EI94DRAFT_1739060 [Lactarius quietus]|nr:hypothetical protein EI94DRAFT_1739060 [Lactarius quietus]